MIVMGINSGWVWSIPLLVCSYMAAAQNVPYDAEKAAIRAESLRLGKLALTPVPGMELHVGDRLPDIPVTVWSDTGVKRVSLGDYRGKALLLSFWNTHCRLCIEGFSKVRALSDQFSQDFHVLYVTFETAETISLFQERQQARYRLPLPTIVGDTTLRRHFPHAGDPYEVWVDPDGTVKALTRHEAINAFTVRKLISGDAFNWEPPASLSGFNQTKLFLVDHNGGPADAFLYRSMVTHYAKNAGGMTFEAKGGRTRIFMANYLIYELYLKAYSLGDSVVDTWLGHDYSFRRFVADSVLRQRFPVSPFVGEQDYGKLNRLKEKYQYCYELTLPTGFSLPQAARFMQEDLDRFFGIRSRIESREVPYLALVYKGDGKKIPDPLDGTVATPEADKLVKRMLRACRSLPVIQSELTQDIPPGFHIELGRDDNVQMVREKLNRKGLDLVSRVGVLDMLVLTDR